MSKINVLFDGYSTMTDDNRMCANCSCVLIEGEQKVIVDTMTPWDSAKILEALADRNVDPEDIDYVVSTHGHSDHIGNNNLFLKAKHIVGYSVSFHDTFFIHPFDKGEEYVISNSIKVIPTPGHTLSDVAVVVTGEDGDKTAITGDLFEKCEDTINPQIWIEAGSEDPLQQIKNRAKVANMVDWIVPGHGPMFKVTAEIRDSLKNQAYDNDYKGT